MNGFIEIENMEFFAFHGCCEEERIKGNIFMVSVKIETDMKLSSESDNIIDALDYRRVYDIIDREMKITSNLLENLCFRIKNSLHDEFSTVKKLTVKVSKLNPPLGGKVEKTSVTQ